MSAAFWRRLAFVLGAACVVLAWRDCAREPADTSRTAARDREASPGDTDNPRESSRLTAHGLAQSRPPSTSSSDCSGDHGPSFYGFKIPPWASALAPQRGENMLTYRDRIVPIARTMLDPQRERVTHSRDDFATAAHLDASQRAVLDSAVKDAADAIETRVVGAVLGGDFAPATFEPMQGVTLARDVLDEVARSDQRFRAALTDDQRATLAQQKFDFADYLLFSTPWEQALGYTQ